MFFQRICWTPLCFLPDFHYFYEFSYVVERLNDLDAQISIVG